MRSFHALHQIPFPTTRPLIYFITFFHFTCHFFSGAGENLNASQFYITTGDNLDSLDEKHTLFGEVAEGWDVLEAINDAPVDDNGRPLQNIRIRHSIILDDPFPDPPTLESHIPEASPPPQFANDGRLEDDWIAEDETRAPEEIEASNREKEAQSRAVVLEMIGDLPEADAAPPENMLFICKLNAVTTEEDLEIIFSRFGTLTSCDIIRDWKTGDSLNYGFIGFDTKEACEEAYFKMNNVLIDDRRIKVDFSQSVHHLWKQFSKFGRKGDAGLMKEAEGHERGGRNQLQLKDQFRRSGGGGGGKYDLVLEDDDDGVERKHGNEPPRQYNSNNSGGAGGGGRSRGGGGEEEIEGRRDRSRDRERKDRHGRNRDRYKHDRRRIERRRSRSKSRSRDRDRHRSRHRSRSRDRDRDGGRSKDNDRERKGRRDRDDDRGYRR
jgi:peptidyl-prolyl cis-trans isomerase-like 4